MKIVFDIENMGVTDCRKICRYGGVTPSEAMKMFNQDSKAWNNGDLKKTLRRSWVAFKDLPPPQRADNKRVTYCFLWMFALFPERGY
ncbi:MAG: hypothetical protein LBR18_00895 [Tannerella sp.]|nr:hypothetical protein [Tannerella sp.]